MGSAMPKPAAVPARVTPATCEQLRAAMIVVLRDIPPPVIDIIAQYTIAKPILLEVVAGEFKPPLAASFADGPGATARFAKPLNCTFWKVPHATSARGGGGSAAAAPTGGGAVAGGDYLVITDFGNWALRALNLHTRVVSTLIPGLPPVLPDPIAVCVVPTDNSLLITDERHVWRLYAADTTKPPMRRLVCGTRFLNPKGITCTPDGTRAVFCDYSSHTIRTAELTTTNPGGSRDTKIVGSGKAEARGGYGLKSAIAFPLAIAYESVQTVTADGARIEPSQVLVCGSKLHRINMHTLENTIIAVDSPPRVRADIAFTAIVYAAPNTFIVSGAHNSGVFTLRLTNVGWKNDAVGTLTQLLTRPCAADGLAFRTAAATGGDDELFICDSGGHQIYAARGSIIPDD